MKNVNTRTVLLCHGRTTGRKHLCHYKTFLSKFLFTVLLTSNVETLEMSKSPFIEPYIYRKFYNY